MVNRAPRMIVCAAIRAKDGEVILGIRHYDSVMIQQINTRFDGWKFMHRNGQDQGFVDQFGVYLSRCEAYGVAANADQIVHQESCTNGPTGWELHSEALY